MPPDQPLDVPSLILQWLASDPRRRVNCSEALDSILSEHGSIDPLEPACAVMDLEADRLVELTEAGDLSLADDVARQFGLKSDKSGEWWLPREQDQRSTDSRVVAETDGPVPLDEMPDKRADDPAKAVEAYDTAKHERWETTFRERGRNYKISDEEIRNPVWLPPLITLVGCQAWPPKRNDDGSCGACNGATMKSRHACLACGVWSNDVVLRAYWRYMDAKRKAEEQAKTAAKFRGRFGKRKKERVGA